MDVGGDRHDLGGEEWEESVRRGALLVMMRTGAIATGDKAGRDTFKADCFIGKDGAESGF